MDKFFGIDPEIAKDTVSLSSMIYKEKKDILEEMVLKSRDLFLIDVFFVNNTEMAIYFKPSRKTLFIVYRGTNGVIDMIRNIRFTTTELNEIQTHSGCARAFRMVDRKIVEKIIIDMIEKDGVNKIMVTGHSQGGGLAQVDAIDLMHENSKIAKMDVGIRCIAYAPMRPFIYDPRLEQYMDRILLVTIPSDPVPNMPPKWFKYIGYDFVDVGTRIAIPEKRKFLGLSQHGIATYEKYLDDYLKRKNKEVIKDGGEKILGDSGETIKG